MVLISSIFVLKGDFRSWRIRSYLVGSGTIGGLLLVGVVIGLTSLAWESLRKGEKKCERVREELRRRGRKDRERGSEGVREWEFCKMFYSWFFGKIFYKFLCTNFGQIENILQLWLYFTCKQTLENRKIFDEKYFKLRLHLVECKIFSKCKIFSSENVFGKGKYFQVFSYIMKIVLENVFMRLVIF